MSRRSNSLERELLYRQVAMKDSSSNSWIIHVQRLLLHYKLPSIIEILENPPGKTHWSSLVRNTVISYWEGQLKDEANQMSSLHHLSLDNCTLRRVHPVWRLGINSGIEVAKATVKVRLLVQRYPLYSSRTSGKCYGQPCPLCQKPNEDLEHFLLECKPLDDRRYPTLTHIKQIVNGFNTDTTFSLVQAILDCGPSTVCESMRAELERLTRHLCYQLHLRRSTILGVKIKPVSRQMKYKL
jgi:hypothetical protein